MRGKEHDRFLIVKHVLSAVAMMHIPIDDEDSFATCGKRCGGDGNVVEEAETHAASPSRVVPGRSNRYEPDRSFAVLEGLDRGQARADRKASRRRRARRHRRVRVEFAPSRGA